MLSRLLGVSGRVTSRRSFMALSALAGLGLPVLAGCDLPGVSKDKGGSASPSGSTASRPATAGSAQTGSTEWQKLDGHVMGHKVSVEVSPVIRQDEASYIALKLTRASDDASVKEINISSYGGDDNKLKTDNYLGAPTTYGPGTGASWTKLLDLGSGRVWSAVDGSGAFLYLSPGEETTAYLSFGKVDTDSVTVMVPMAGFTTVSVLDANDAKKAGINLTTAKQELAKWPNAITKDKDTAPVTIERYTRALDDSTSTHAGGKDITVTLASDVTFASDSADLTPQADTQLKTVSAQLAQYPDGGALTIVGHTDDVQDDAYNQTLSEKRANAVKTRLEQLTSLDKWQTSVSGKGESEPKINDTSDQARAANRRVEITLTPTGGTTTKTTTPSAGTGSLPENKGPVAKGSEGVTVKHVSGNSQLTITIDHVTRSGGYLLGQLHTTLSVKKGSAPNGLEDWLSDKEALFSNSRSEAGSRDAVTYAATGLTLLAGGERIYPADYRDAGFKTHVPLTELQLTPPIKAGTTTVCVIWPDPGGDTVTLDHAATGKEVADLGYRLTDIPVKNS